MFFKICKYWIFIKRKNKINEDKITELYNIVIDLKQENSQLNKKIQSLIIDNNQLKKDVEILKEFKIKLKKKKKLKKKQKKQIV